MTRTTSSSAANARPRRRAACRGAASEREPGSDDDEADAAGVVALGAAAARRPPARGSARRRAGAARRAGLDGALVLPVDLEVVGDRAHLADPSAGASARIEPGAVAVLGARGVELLERLQPGADAGQLVLARAQLRDPARRGRARAPASSDSRRRAIDAQRRPSPRAPGPSTSSAAVALLLGALRFDLEVAALDLELGELLARSALRGRRRVPSRGAAPSRR